MRPNTHTNERSTRAAQHVAALSELPGSFHLFEYLTGTGHYHFGLFEDEHTLLENALDALPRLLARSFPVAAEIPFRTHERRAGRILDVGCGLGGSARLWDEAGHQVTAIDMSPEVVKHARQAGKGGDCVNFETCAFEDLPATLKGQFDVVVLTEVTQHFDDLGGMFESCRRALASGGRVIVSDVVTYQDEDRACVPYHRRGLFERAAARHGLRLTKRSDETKAVVPTLTRMSQLLSVESDALIELFVSRRQDIAAEIEELVRLFDNLRIAFDQGDLYYEINVFEADRR